ncbi:MAG: transcriptional regulator [Shinella sp.]|nr:transcriptional regulator [Shinella sp.]
MNDSDRASAGLASGIPELSAMELRCLALAAEGKTPGDIVLATDLPMAQVTNALSSAVERLGARNITGAISRAARLKLI